MDPIAVQASPAITSHYLRNQRNIPTKSWLLQSQEIENALEEKSKGLSFLKSSFSEDMQGD